MRHQFHDFFQRMLGQILAIVTIWILFLHRRQSLLVDTLLVVIVRLVVRHAADVLRILRRVRISFCLRTTILEPHFDLSIGQVQFRCQYQTTVTGNVMADHELLFQLLDLSPCVRTPRPRTGFACKKYQKKTPE